MTITNETQLANSLETLLRVGFDYLGIIDPYDRILVALSALHTYSDKMHKCATVDDLLTYLVDACETLQPLDEESKAPEFGLYVSTQLDVAFEYANYNDAVTLQVLKETEIEVPVDEKGSIDYDAVRDKMRPIMEKARTHVDQLVTQYKRYKEKNHGKL